MILCSIHPDINECAVDKGGCSQTCTNTVGSFICGCYSAGYTLDIDRITCDGMQKLYIAFKHTYKPKYVEGFHIKRGWKEGI